MHGDAKARSGAGEETAVQALKWLAETDDLLRVFLGSSGLNAAELAAQIRSGAPSSEMLAAVMDFILMDDSWVMAFCLESGRDPKDMIAVRANLPGGAAPDWT